MNNWLKVGAPILIALLLIVSAVSITVAVTRADTVKQLSYAGNVPSQTGNLQQVQGGLCPNCPGYAQNTNGNQSAANPGYRYGGCCSGRVSDNNGQGNTGTYGYRGCCGR